MLSLPVITVILAVAGVSRSLEWSTRPVLAAKPLAPASIGKVAQRTAGTLSALVIFTRFQGEAVGEVDKPAWADDIFDRQREGSFAHFYDEMSRGQLRVEGQVLQRRYASSEPASAYVADTPGTQGKFGLFNLDILEQADRDVDMGLFDNDGPDGIPNSGDDDGYVDVVFINLLTVPRDFFISTATGLASLGLDADFVSDDVAATGGFVRIRSRFNGFGGTTQRGQTFSVTASTMSHEFGHFLGLPDLFDQSSVFLGDELTYEEDSAGIGKWGIMGLGTLGWNVEDGPNAFCAWSLAHLGWLGRDNENLVTVTESLQDVVVEQIDRGGTVYKIPISTDEYFLVENRQNSGSYYNRNIPGGGLLVWHVDERADNDEELHKQVDLVCADGLYTDKGFPGSVADPVSGRDNLDFWSKDSAYATEHSGNQGDAGDPFDGVRYTRLASDSNPGARVHTGRSRNLSMGFALENIRSVGGGRMRLDILIRQPLSGHIVADTTWSGRVSVDGDITVERGATLRIEAGTTVEFARGDSRGSGFSERRGELLVYGNLELGTGADPVTLRSAAASPRNGDWMGVFLMDGQSAGIDQALAAGRLVVSHSTHGLLRRRLPPGSTVWRAGTRRLPWDLVVPEGSILEVEAGARVNFASDDLGASGRSAGLVELDIAGELRVRGTATREATFTVDSSRGDDLWYGVIMRAGASVDAEYLDLSQTVVALDGQVTREGGLRFTDGSIRRSVVGIRVNVETEVSVERSTFTVISSEGIRAEGGGLRVINSEFSRNGREGISLGDCSLEAIGTRFEQNGLLSTLGEEPSSGVSAEGGAGRRIELWNCFATGNSLHGLELDNWLGRVEIHGSELSANQSQGLVVDGVELLVLEDSRIERNLGGGATVENAPVEIWSTTFADNLGTGLILQEGASAVVEMSEFRNNAGLLLSRAGDTAIRTSVFENARLGLVSVDSAPSIVFCRFQNNLTGIRVEGAKVPADIRDNTFLENPMAIQNLSGRKLEATGNYWGTADTSAIAALFEGAVDWAPFLDSEPVVSAVEEGQAPTPERYALYGNYPNPFNAGTVIPFDLPEEEVVHLMVHDVLGQLVRSIVDGSRMAAGHHAAAWDGRGDDGTAAASGVYFYRLRAGDFGEWGRMLLVR
ncbi:MAG: right-handed parallel beta-helix repeat-containing protein [Candidatus Latescibacterota bacterium]|nr:right-handed parallel beta-helix repeat-containing protein [Candidatus Latescibacterota bacterium]